MSETALLDVQGPTFSSVVVLMSESCFYLMTRRVACSLTHDLASQALPFQYVIDPPRRLPGAHRSNDEVASFAYLKRSTRYLVSCAIHLCFDVSSYTAFHFHHAPCLHSALLFLVIEVSSPLSCNRFRWGPCVPESGPCICFRSCTVGSSVTRALDHPRIP